MKNNQIKIFDFSFMKNDLSIVYTKLFNNINCSNKSLIENYIKNKEYSPNDENEIYGIYNLIKNNNPKILENDIKSFVYTINYIKILGGWDNWVLKYHEQYIM